MSEWQQQPHPNQNKPKPNYVGNGRFGNNNSIKLNIDFDKIDQSLLYVSEKTGRRYRQKIDRCRHYKCTILISRNL